MKSSKVEEKIENIVKELKKYKPKRIILFGSRAKGYGKRSSDIDIAVDLKLTFREKRKLKEKLDRIAGIYSIDLVFLPDVSGKFKENILKEGKVLYEENRCIDKNPTL